MEDTEPPSKGTGDHDASFGLLVYKYLYLERKFYLGVPAHDTAYMSLGSTATRWENSFNMIYLLTSGQGEWWRDFLGGGGVGGWGGES